MVDLPSILSDRACLDTVLRAALEAGAAILDVYHGDLEVTRKDDRSPLTRADRRSHEILVGRLAGVQVDAPDGLGGTRRTALPCLSEEGGEIPYGTRKAWDCFWLVDPLDGTREFIGRNGEFTVNIALVHRGRPVLGVIHVPVKARFYFAVRGRGAHRLDAADGMPAGDVFERATRLPATPRDDASRERDGITIVGSRSHPSPGLRDCLDRMQARYGRVRFMPAGSALKFCLVAEGAADLYPRYGPTMEWDTAAGQCLVEEAGCTMVEAASGAAMAYNKPDLTNPGFVVLRDGVRMS